MKNQILIAAAIAVAATGIAASPVQAGPFDKLKRAVKKVEEVAEDVETVVEVAEETERTGGRNIVGAAAAVTGGRNAAIATGVAMSAASRSGCDATGGTGRCTAKRPGYAGVAPTPSAKFTSMTQCAGLPISNAFVGRFGDYTFQQGLSQEERSGIVDREPVSASQGCIMPSMASGDVLYLEVPAKQWASMKGGWKMQCVEMRTGKNANSEAFPRWSNIAGKDIMLHTGNSLGYEPTASGSNSDRSRAWDKDLERRGKHMLGFNMPDLHNDKGTDFYCQYYNAASGKSVAAFAYRRGATRR
ncbi:hypothetical protein [Qipengyuania flava]|uniref:hypothetical protein n=1 Tax=Qipengyuania flava TaxID=192812 RepID=UPI001C6381EB|nr:hypothetical protein [Qipengyuania flava]QYJ07844.1 hypothetical protein KUV82_03785 [Qipengyuania flava]